MSTAQARAAEDARLAEEAARSSLSQLAAVAQPAAPPANDSAPVDQQPPAPAPAPAPTAQPVNVEEQLRRMQHQIDSDRGRLQQLEQENQRLRAAPPAPPAPPTPAPAPAELITAKDREEYGDDLIDLVQRVVKQITGTSLSDLQAKATMLEGQLGNVRTRVEQTSKTAEEIAMERYENALNQLAPGWQAVNEDPAFIDWLGNVDKLSSKSYMELLQSAHRSADAQRVAHIFKLYKPDLGSAPPAATPPAAPPQNTGHIDPSSLAAPATMPSAPAPAAPPPGKVWTQSDVDKMFDDDAKGRITKQQFLALEADYMKALREGRVQAQ